MNVTIFNNQLAAFINLLNATPAKGKNARAVARFKKLLLQKFDTFAAEEQDLLKEYCVLTANNEIKIHEDGNFKFIESKKKMGMAALTELRTESQILVITEFHPYLLNLISALENSEQLLQDAQAEAMDDLLTLLEGIKEGGQDVKDD